MDRDNCYRCMRSASSCLCPTEAPLPVRTKIVLLMHDKEWRRQKSGTGRLACLNLAGSEIIPGLGFDDNPRVMQLMADPAKRCVLLYPGDDAVDLSAEPFPAQALGLDLAPRRQLVVFIIDATWSCSRAVLRASPGLLDLPRLMFRPREKSRWIIKKQPADWCLSTIEAIHELLLALEGAGLDSYPDKQRLLAVFAAMQTYQIDRAAAGYNPRRKTKKAERRE
ncbi:MAG: tRNA-uridine aminocarboxypropyltransferase [Spirochaetota bacterium]